jgi:hypothetical protein
LYLERAAGRRAELLELQDTAADIVWRCLLLLLGGRASAFVAAVLRAAAAELSDARFDTAMEALER